MKKSIILLLVVFITGCNASKENSAKIISDELTTNCPEGGECSIVIHKNKKLNVLSDDFGSKYYQILDNLETSVILFEFKKTVEENLQDGNYLEELIFEIENDVKSLNLNDIELQKTKMIYGRHCYCKGQAGYFNVTNGKLRISNVKNEIKLKLDFKINEVPQLITSIAETIK